MKSKNFPRDKLKKSWGAVIKNSLSVLWSQETED